MSAIVLVAVFAHTLLPLTPASQAVAVPCPTPNPHYDLQAEGSGGVLLGATVVLPGPENVGNCMMPPGGWPIIITLHAYGEWRRTAYVEAQTIANAQRGYVSMAITRARRSSLTPTIVPGSPGTQPH